MGQVIGDGMDTNITGPVTVSATGALAAILGKAQQACLVEDIVKGAHRAKEAEEPLLRKGAGQ